MCVKYKLSFFVYLRSTFTGLSNITLLLFQYTVALYTLTLFSQNAQFNFFFFFSEGPKVTVAQQDILVSVGGDATLECQATGVPPPLVHWFKGKLRSKTVCTSH